MALTFTEWEHCGFPVSYSEKGKIFSVHEVGMSVDTLQTCHLQKHHPNVSVSGTRQQQTRRRVLLPTTFTVNLCTITHLVNKVFAN